MSVHYIKAKNIRGQMVDLEEYKGKVLLIINTASKCGFTPQYEDLQKLHEKYKDRGLVLLGFPCNQFGEQEPGTNEDVSAFCQLNYGVTFPLFDKVEVRGPGKHPLFAYLADQAPFTGFDLTSSGGKMLHTFLSDKLPEFLEGNDIKWNFTKFLVDGEGRVVRRFESPVSPLDIEAEIEALLG